MGVAALGHLDRTHGFVKLAMEAPLTSSPFVIKRQHCGVIHKIIKKSN